MSPNATQEDLIGILMPKISNYEKFAQRYAGLENEIRNLGATAAFAFTHDNYDPSTHSLLNLINTRGQSLFEAARPSIVRDLTMPKSDSRPIYLDPHAPTLVHSPEFNAFLRDKSNMVKLLPEVHPQTVAAIGKEVREAAATICGATVVVKPVTGERSQGIFIGKKESLPESWEDGHYLVQEFIDTSKGVSELGIKNVHNVRLLSINSELVGAIGRINDAGGNYLHGHENDLYGRVYLPEELPQTMVDIADVIQNKLKALPGKGRNVIAIDLMRGFNSRGEEIDVLCEVNRRPLRISPFDLTQPQRDPNGIVWLARQWDIKEARMLDNIR